MSKLIAAELIAQRILEVREKKVILDKDLARLYGVEVKVLNQAVRRNIRRFPEDFMFQLSWDEAKCLRSQIVTLKQGQNIKYLPYVFTEQGVAMLSSVLNSERAIQVNILIMRAFTKLREVLINYKGLVEKIEALENKYAGHDETIKAILNAIKQLVNPSGNKERVIKGFRVGR